RLVERGLRNELAKMTGAAQATRPVFSAGELHALHKRFDREAGFSDEFLSKYKGLVFQIRSEGVSLSDRRVVKLLKLCAASALVDGRPRVTEADLFVLKHVWNSVDQAPLLGDIVTPVLERYEREHPEERRLRA